jgi:hypothetical protein
MTTIRQAFPPNGPEYPIDPEEKLFDPLEAVTGIPALDPMDRFYLAMIAHRLAKVRGEETSFLGAERRAAFRELSRADQIEATDRAQDDGGFRVQGRAFDDPVYDYSASPSCSGCGRHPDEEDEECE